MVEQRSPKPRAVSSRLTTPATNAQVLRSLCVLFLRCFCVLELAPLRSANISGKIIFICTSGKSADFPEVPFHGRGRSGEQYFLSTVPVTGEIVPGSNTFYLQYLLRARSFREAAFRHLLWLGLPNSFHQLQREGSLSEGAGTAQAMTEGVSSHFFRFLKFMLDKCGVFRYNKARSGGKRRAKLERSWPGSSVG